MYVKLNIKDHIKDDFEFQSSPWKLKNLYKSKINIIWDTPREKISEAFSAVLLYDKLKNSLQNIMKVIIENDSFADANTSVNKLEIEHSLTDIINFDKGLINLEKSEREKDT